MVDQANSAMRQTFIPSSRIRRTSSGQRSSGQCSGYQAFPKYITLSPQGGTISRSPHCKVWDNSRWISEASCRRLPPQSVSPLHGAGNVSTPAYRQHPPCAPSLARRYPMCDQAPTPAECLRLNVARPRYVSPTECFPATPPYEAAIHTPDSATPPRIYVPHPPPPLTSLSPLPAP